MPAAETPVAYLGIDVGKSSHSALAEFGGAAGCSAAGWRRFSSAARRAGAPAAGARRLWEALLASSRSGRRLPAGEDVAVRILAREIASLDADIEELDSLVADSLAGDEVYECLLTVPGIGPKTAAALVTSIDISAFRGHDELASYCGVAPSDRRSGSSIRSTSPQHGGNRQLKNLLIFSCNSLIGTDNRFGRYYGECRARGMRHSKALKAVARKRLKVIYAIMRDAVPYAA
ncbi:MAG: transposase [Collinsella sp.]